MSHRIIAGLLVALFLGVFGINQALSQITRIDDTTSVPIPGAGHDYIKLLSETVNPANGAVSMRIQLPTPSGRGISLPFSIAYDSGAVHHLYTSDPVNDVQSWGDNSASLVAGAGKLARGGWSFTVPAASNSYWVNRIMPYPYIACEYENNYIFQDGNGGRHDLALGTNDVQSNSPSQQYSNCPYAYEYHTVGGDPQVSASFQCATCYGTGGSFYVQDRTTGTTYYFNYGNTGSNLFWSLPASIEDRNGNKITSTFGGSVTSFTDTVGRTLVSFPNDLSSVTVSGQPYAVTWTTVSSNYQVSAHILTGVSGTSPACTAASIPAVNTSQTVISQITLPNGSKYQFQYDNTYGLLKKIIYPSGGWVQYTWKMSDTDAEVYVYVVPDPNYTGWCVASYKVPVVATRTVSFDGTTTSLTQTFSNYYTTWQVPPAYNGGPLWNAKSVDETSNDPTFGSALTHYDYVPYVQPDSYYPPISGLTHPPGGTNAIPLESQVKYYDWGNTVVPIRTTAKSWNNPFQVTSESETFSNGKTSGHGYGYAYGQIADTTEYDFGQGSPGNLVRHTHINFQSFTPPSAVAGGLNFGQPTSSIIYDGAGNRVAETDYAYDEISVSPLTGIVQHDDTYYGTSFNTRANLTTRTVKCFVGATNCTDSVTKYAYDMTGQLLTSVDACGNISCADMVGTNHTTTYSHADAFTALSGGSNVPYTPSNGATNAYLTQITDPLNHTSKFTHDYTSGQPTSEQDQNDITASRAGTTYVYNDPFARPTQVSYPDGGFTTYSYNDSPYNASANTPSVTTTKAIASGVNLVSTVAADGAEHVVRSIVSSDPDGAVTTNTTYDGFGTVLTQSNPHRSGTSSTDGTTIYTYDALGRTKSVRKQDNSTVATVYDQTSSNPAVTCSTTTDEVGKSRKSCTDGLGRLAQVFEDPSGSNYETDYQYDLLNSLLRVDQKGNDPNSANWRTRLFTYDSLSRLLTASNPESGTISYSYDPNGNLSSKVAPLPNQTGSATVTTTYLYDVLNRVLQKSYSDGTPTANFYYDTAPAVWASGEQNTTGRLVEATTGHTPAP